MRDLEIDGFTALDNRVQVTWPSCFYAHAIIVVGTMRHVRDKLCQHKVVPVRSCTCQWRLPSPVYVSVDHVWDAIVHANNNAGCGCCILQMESNVLWWITTEIYVVAKADVTKCMECLQPLPRPHHSWTCENVQGSALGCPIIVYFHCYWCPTSVHVVPIHNLQNQMSMLPFDAFVCSPLIVKCTTLPPNAGLGVHWSNGCPDA
mmetsp:Transcript_108823/g.216110  ORF Transcript_108823/g.216110 Transcript_108823/m.216110 type:complete len:204 (-) Transcript_108823:1117-1728(-)